MLFIHHYALHTMPVIVGYKYLVLHVVLELESIPVFNRYNGISLTPV